MANKEQEEIFHFMTKSTEIEDRGYPGNFCKGWEVIRECWRMREAENDEKGIYWVDAMEKLELHLLLI